jgi:hypothetical protein
VDDCERIEDVCAHWRAASPGKRNSGGSGAGSASATSLVGSCACRNCLTHSAHGWTQSGFVGRRSWETRWAARSPSSWLCGGQRRSLGTFRCTLADRIEEKLPLILIPGGPTASTTAHRAHSPALSRHFWADNVVVRHRLVQRGPATCTSRARSRRCCNRRRFWLGVRQPGSRLCCSKRFFSSTGAQRLRSRVCAWRE